MARQCVLSSLLRSQWQSFIPLKFTLGEPMSLLGLLSEAYYQWEVAGMSIGDPEATTLEVNKTPKADKMEPHFRIPAQPIYSIFSLRLRSPLQLEQNWWGEGLDTRVRVPWPSPPIPSMRNISSQQAQLWPSFASRPSEFLKMAVVWLGQQALMKHANLNFHVWVSMGMFAFICLR